MALPPDPPSEEHADTRSRRWRVMLVRVAPAAWDRFHEWLPGQRKVGRDDLPLVVRVTRDPSVADSTAERLRAAGGVVVLVEEPSEAATSAFCLQHPSRLAARACLTCGAPVCTDCRTKSHGEELCSACFDRGRSPRRRVRLRQLFAVFLFAVFLFEIARVFAVDRAATDPFGTVRVVVLQFAPPELLDSPILHQLNALPGPSVSSASTASKDRVGRSLHDIGPWFNEERSRYGGVDRAYLQVTIKGPWGRRAEPPALALPDDPLWKIAAQSWRYARYFPGLALDHGVDLDDYAVHVFVLYTDRQGDVASESRGSREARLAVPYISLQEQNPGYAVVTVAHELAHTLGAVDLYDPDSALAEFPRGFIDPWQAPLYPQPYAELMSVDRPVAPASEVEASSLHQVRIGYATAAHMGWIGEEQADLYYSPASVSPPRSPTSVGPALPPEPAP